VTKTLNFRGEGQGNVGGIAELRREAAKEVTSPLRRRDLGVKSRPCGGIDDQKARKGKKGNVVPHAGPPERKSPIAANPSEIAKEDKAEELGGKLWEALGRYRAETLGRCTKKELGRGNEKDSARGKKGGCLGGVGFLNNTKGLHEGGKCNKERT